MTADEAAACSRKRAVAPRPDFRRRVYCLLGLPIDGVTLSEAVSRIGAASALRACVLSTPNVNILLASHRDARYRASLIGTDLSVADGMPLIWIARLLGIPVRERVAGWSLFEALVRGEGGALKVYFFGGQDGAAQAACDRLNSQSGPLHCVGAASPGFGTIEQMSGQETIERINRSGADFLIVAMAAKKAQLWIEHNHRALEPPVMGALGALVKFVGGRISRAPRSVQKLGLEWLWRIKEEPALWRRYLADGITLLRLLLTNVLPGIAFRVLGAFEKRTAPSVVAHSRSGRTLLTLAGSWSEADLPALRGTLEEMTATAGDVDLDLSKLARVDHAFIALLMLLYGHQSTTQRAFRIVSASPQARRAFRLSCAEFLFDQVPNGASHAC